MDSASANVFKVAHICMRFRIEIHNAHGCHGYHTESSSDFGMKNEFITVLSQNLFNLEAFFKIIYKIWT